MKLIFVNRFFYPDRSATSQLLTSLAIALAARGWEVHVVASRLRYEDPGAALPAREMIKGIQVDRVWTLRFGRSNLAGRAVDYLTFYFSAAWRLWRLARRDDIVVAKTDPPILSVVAAGVAATRGAKLVNWLQDVYPEIAQVLRMPGVHGVFERWLRGLRNWSVRRAQVDVVLCERMRARIENAGVWPARITLIPNWECGRTIRPVSREDNELRREWGLANRFVVGYSGNMGRAHDFVTMIDAAERLGSGVDELAFLWIGDGSQRLWLQQEAHRRGLTNFMFKPYQPRERLAESLSVSDVHLMSLQPELEGLVFPSKFYGVLAAGRPILHVGDPAGDMAVELRERQCGYTIEPDDSAALAARIKFLSLHMENCQQMGARARHAFVTHYDESFAIARWETLLKNVANSPPALPPQTSSA